MVYRTTDMLSGAEGWSCTPNQAQRGAATLRTRGGAASAGRTRRRLTLDEVDLYGCALGMDWREAWDLHQPLIAAVGAEVIRAMWDELVEIDRQRAAAIERLRAVAMSDAPAMPPEHDQVGKWIRIE